MAQARGVQQGIRIGRLERQVEQQRQRDHGQALDEVEPPLIQHRAFGFARRLGKHVGHNRGHEHAQRRSVDAKTHLAEGPDLRRRDDCVDDRRDHWQGGGGHHEPGLGAHHALAQEQIDSTKEQKGEYAKSRQRDGNPAPGQIAHHR